MVSKNKDEILNNLLADINEYYQPRERVKDQYSVCPSPLHQGDRSGANCRWDLDELGRLTVSCYSRACPSDSILQGATDLFPAYREQLPIKVRGHLITPQEVETLVPRQVAGDFRIRFNCEVDGTLYEVRKSTNWGKRVYFEREPEGLGGIPFLTRFCVGKNYIDPDQPVYLVEGPKTALWLAKHGWQAACWPGGANYPEQVNYEDLREALVVCWPDDDSQGRQAMEKAGRLARYAGAKEVKILDWAAGETGRDAADLTPAEIAQVVQNSAWHGPPADHPNPYIEVATELLLQMQYRLAYVEDLHVEVNKARTSNPQGLMYYNKVGILNEVKEDWLTIRVTEILETMIARNNKATSEMKAQLMEQIEDVALDQNLNSPKRRKKVQALVDEAVKLGQIGDKVVVRPPSGKPKTLGELTNPTEIHKVHQALGPAMRWLDDQNLEPPLTRAYRSELNAQAGYIGTPAGIFHLPSQTLLPLEEARSLLVSHQLPVKPERVDEPNTADAVFELMEDWQKTMLCQYLYLALGGWRPKNFFVWISPRNGGKSTLVRALLQLFGDYGTPINVGPFTERRDENSATPGLEMLRDKRLGVVQEAGGKVLNSERLKLMSGGLDQDISRGLYKGFNTLDSTAALFFAGNTSPRLDWNDSAVTNRLLLIETRGREDHEVRRNIGDTFIGALNSLVLQRLLTIIIDEGSIDPNSTISRPENMLETIESEQAQYGTPLDRWIEKTLVRADDHWLTSDQLWDLWQGYVLSTESTPYIQRITQTTLGTAVRAKFDGSRPMARRRSQGGVQTWGYPVNIVDDQWWNS